MLYHFELQMAGVILLSTMLVCGIWLYIKRRRERLQDPLMTPAEESLSSTMQNDDKDHNNDNDSNEKNDNNNNNKQTSKPNKNNKRNINTHNDNTTAKHPQRDKNRNK